MEEEKERLMATRHIQLISEFSLFSTYLDARESVMVYEKPTLNESLIDLCMVQ